MIFFFFLTQSKLRVFCCVRKAEQGKKKENKQGVISFLALSHYNSLEIIVYFNKKITHFGKRQNDTFPVCQETEPFFN